MEILENKIKEIIFEVKKNKKYSGISEYLVKDKILYVLKKNPRLLNFLERKKSEEYSQIIKGARKLLHENYAVFQKSEKKEINSKIKELENADKNEFLRIHKEILSSNLSTKERLEDYGKIYNEIFSMTERPKSILDLGCGFNPFSWIFMNLNKLDYYAYEISEKDIDILNKYFNLVKKRGLNGKTKVFSFENAGSLKIPKTDICFLFKVLDVIDKKGHKNSENLIRKINSKYIVASFSTKTISGKQMNFAHRGWIERMLERLKLNYKKFKTENEVFYVVKNF